MENSQRHLEQRILALPAHLQFTSSGNKTDDIYKIVMSHKFRKYSVSPEYKIHIQQVIKNCIETDNPIPFVWVFGGYKLWSLPTAPYVDWAELFSLIYFVDWLRPILTIHKPGVWFDFYSDDCIVPIMNNISQNDTKAYISSFQELLHFISPKLPEGFHYTLHRVIDQYENERAFKEELEKNITSLTAERKSNPTQLTADQIAAIDLNVKITGTQKHDPHWREKIQIIHDAYSKTSKRRPYYRTPDKIMVLNTPIPGALAVGTTKSSVVKFWVGTGVLEKRNGGYSERILSPKQFAATNRTAVNIRISGLTGKNFSSLFLTT